MLKSRYDHYQKSAAIAKAVKLGHNLGQEERRFNLKLQRELFTVREEKIFNSLP